MKWHRRYLELAREISRWSKDPSTQVGAVAVNPETGQILSTGYNGFPRGIEDTEERLNDRTVKLCLTIHAELNTILNASLTGVSLKGSHMYVYGLPPCSTCTLSIIQSGIKKVFFLKTDIEKSDRWKESWNKSKQLLDEAGIEYEICDIFLV